MEPRIQYAQTKDGVSIAFYTLGEGMPLILMSWIPYSHLEREWQTPQLRRLLERHSEKRMLIRYDNRGSGLSDRDVADYSLDAHLLDLEAVVGHLSLERFALLGRGSSGPVAIAYAARNPERVSRLVLAPMSYARASDYWPPQVQPIWALMEVDWELFTETAAHWALGWSEGEAARVGAAYFRECVTQQQAVAAYRALREVDVADQLSLVRAPTLVVHVRALRWPEVGLARGLAARIPNARLVVAEDAGKAVAAIDEFLGEGEEVQAEAQRAEAGAFRTILFTDVEGSTALTQRLGDAKAREVMRGHEGLVREVLKAHGGSELKTMGDGFMASFSSATKALECAIAMQRAFAAHNESAEEPILVRVGMNAGEPIAEEEDLFGTAGIRAARIAGEAKGGEILVANVVRELAEGKQFLFADRGEVALKGFDEPVRLYEVRWQD
jgi:class 3 adenylate cyclase